jgi:antitoxin MazE
METKIQKWGNSLGVRLPKELTQKHSLTADTLVRVSDTKKGITITALPPKKKASLKDLVSAITSKNTHSEVAWGEARGNEIW